MMAAIMTEFMRYPDAPAVARAAADAIATHAETAIAARGAFHVVLAGGSTPEAAYRLLAAMPCDWPRWQVYFGDERCLPVDHPERNGVMAHRALLDAVPIPEQHVHIMPAQLGPDRAAREYATTLAGVERFDLVLLGLGEDGHTASLFPGHDWGCEQDAPAVLAVRGAPKPPPERVSLSCRRLNQSRAALFLVAGRGKRDALARWRAGERLPAGAIHALETTQALIDAAAWPEEKS
jgi:6-phosphogluconolactonase